MGIIGDSSLLTWCDLFPFFPLRGSLQESVLPLTERVALAITVGSGTVRSGQEVFRAPCRAVNKYAVYRVERQEVCRVPCRAAKKDAVYRVERRRSMHGMNVNMVKVDLF